VEAATGAEVEGVSSHCWGPNGRPGAPRARGPLDRSRDALEGGGVVVTETGKTLRARGATGLRDAAAPSLELT